MNKSLLSLLALGLIIAAADDLLRPALAQQSPSAAPAKTDAPKPDINLALVATPSASYVSGDQTLAALNNGFNPRNSRDHSHSAFGNWPRTATQWVQYEWTKPISTNRMDIYWYGDGRGLRPPKAYRVQYWDGNAFVNVAGAAGLGVDLDKYNTTTFAEVTTTRLRLEFDSLQVSSVGISQWKIYDSGKSPKFAPMVSAGMDRIVVESGKTYLNGTIKVLGNDKPAAVWSKASGAGDVTFADANSLTTTATFSQTGEYALRLTASVADSAQPDLSGSDTLNVRVEAPAPAQHLEPVATTSYKINNPLWNDRFKALIVNWIPHCVAELSDLNLAEGGINNFIQAANKLAGKPAGRHVGYPFSNAYVYNTLEAMCIALQVDPGTDAELVKSQDAMRVKINEWIPIILGAQEPDGYIQTRFTLDPRNARHWTIKSEHEGYTAGYFLEAAIAHFQSTNKTDRRMYDAAKRLADCWDNNIGPAPKKAWYDGHEEMEQALVRFARLVNQTDGAGKGDKYIALAKFLMDCRKNGDGYDQTQLPVTQQYEAVGHAVRAVYLYTGMSDVAMETGNIDYQSAVRSLWDNIVNRKYYITGGVGSGETSEGFGPNYSLRNNAYCESCSGCGELFFQYSMGLANQDAKYADLYEQTLYNAILGDIDLEGTHFTYTNALDETGLRAVWHNCPCCVGNIPRTLLQLPTWMYAKSADSLYVNLYVGSTVNIENVAGTNVRMVQETDYPWNGNIAITVNPSESKTFSIRVRVPNRDVSTLYTSSPSANGITSISVNGSAISPTIEKNYAVITRQWNAGDKVQLVLPMAVQQVKAGDKVAADIGRVALRYGPLVYNIENVDQNITQPLGADPKFSTEWRNDFLHGVRVITGQFANGSPLLAVPNYARNNRGDRRTESIVWIRHQ